MAKTKLEAIWWFALDARETALMLASLGGRLRPEQESAARELGDKLTELRAKESDHFAEQMERHLRNMERA
jgi:hypothetical protein